MTLFLKSKKRVIVLAGFFGVCVEGLKDSFSSLVADFSSFSI